MCERKPKFDTYFVLKGLQNGEEGVFATSTTNDKIEDGWYWLVDAEFPPIEGADEGIGPFMSKEAAERSAMMALEKVSAVVLGYHFEPMKQTDWDAFAGAEEGTLIHHHPKFTLLWDPKQAVLSEVDHNGSQRDWRFVWVNKVDRNG